MRSSSHTRIRKWESSGDKEKNAKRDGRHREKILYIVGIGPGHFDHLSIRAREVLDRVDYVVGYQTYIELIRPLIKDKHIVSAPMKKEVERVEAAIEIAQKGNRCALVSSGDPGVYAMAGLVFEMCRHKNLSVTPAAYKQDALKSHDFRIEIIPGIPALCSGAALLGAPLTHDFAAVSLSDLLTPWETIVRRLDAAAAADFVIVLYNPKSKRRKTQLEDAQKTIMIHRHPDTPVGIVRSAMRKEQEVTILPLKHMNTARINMQTTIFVGNSESLIYGDYLITPRGYSQKYDLAKKSVSKSGGKK